MFERWYRLAERFVIAAELQADTAVSFAANQRRVVDAQDRIAQAQELWNVINTTPPLASNPTEGKSDG